MTERHGPPAQSGQSGQSVNYGIQVTGGTFNANSVAVGPHARAESAGPGPLAADPALLATLRTQVDELLEALALALAAQGEQGDDVADALVEVQTTAAELAKPEPERSVVVAALRRAAAGVTAAGSLAGSFKAVLELLGVR